MEKGPCLVNEKQMIEIAKKDIYYCVLLLTTTPPRPRDESCFFYYKFKLNILNLTICSLKIVTFVQKWKA